MTRNLIVNGDGFGFTIGINRGIEEAVGRGIVTSISVNANFDACDELPAFAQRWPSVSIGVHLNPVVGRPIADPRDIRSLVTPRGEFRGRDFTRRLLTGRIDLGEMEHELSLQIERVRDMKVQISHLDSHQNRHLYPPFFIAFLRLLERHRIPCMRTHAHLALAESSNRRAAVPAFYAQHPHRFLTHLVARLEMRVARRRGVVMADRLMSTSATGDKADQEKWLQLLRNVPEGWTEVFCHPALADDELPRWASYVEPRRREVEVLTSKRTREEVERCRITLRTFHDLARARADGTVRPVGAAGP
jgi:chitin disaccharide deacetylase